MLKAEARSKPQRQSASELLRVRLTPKEKEDLEFWAGERDVSEYVRIATRRYDEVFRLTAYLEHDLTERALTTFECNLLSIVNPEYYIELGGAELTKPPTERQRIG